MVEAFVYCWTDVKTNKLYIGSHKGTVNDGYVCSSKLMLQEYTKRPQDFTRQIVAEGNDDLFYNQHNGFGTYLNDEVKKKIGEKSRQVWSNKEFKEKMSKKQKERHKNTSEENKNKWKEKISKSNSRPKTEKEKQNMRDRKSTRLNSSHIPLSRMPSSA